MPVVQIPCYCATLRQATRAITALYDERFKPAGLRATQFTILQTLDFQPGARIADMVEWLAIDQTTKGTLPKDLSEKLKRIEKLAKQLRSQVTQ